MVPVHGLRAAGPRVVRRRERGTRSHSPPPVRWPRAPAPCLPGTPPRWQPHSVPPVPGQQQVGPSGPGRQLVLAGGRGGRWADVCKHPRWNLLSEMMSAVLKFQTRKDTGCLCLSKGPEPDQGDERETCQTLGAGPGPRDKHDSCHSGRSRARPHTGPAHPAPWPRPPRQPSRQPPGLASPCDLSSQKPSPEGRSPVPGGARVGALQPASRGHSDSAGELGGGGCERPRAAPQAHHEHPILPAAGGTVRRDREATPLPSLPLPELTTHQLPPPREAPAPCHNGTSLANTDAGFSTSPTIRGSLVVASW